MEDLIASLPVIAGTLIVVILIFWLTGRIKIKKTREIQDLATREGWVYEPVDGRLESGFRLKGEEWIFESISRSKGIDNDSGSSNIEQTTRWKSIRPGAADRLIMIGERPTASKAPFAEDLIQKAFLLAMGGEGEGMSEVAAGTTSLRKRYLMMSRSARDFEYLLTPRLENLLVNFQGSAPVMKLNASGTMMEFKGQRIEKPEEILSIIRLGEAFQDAQTS